MAGTPENLRAPPRSRKELTRCITTRNFEAPFVLSLLFQPNRPREHDVTKRQGGAGQVLGGKGLEPRTVSNGGLGDPNRSEKGEPRKESHPFS